MRRGHRLPRRGLPGALALGLSCALLAGLGTPTRADTRSELEGTKAELSALVARIGAGEAAASRLQADILVSAAKLAKARARGSLLAVEVAQTRSDLAAAGAEYATIRARLDARARELYMSGPLSGLTIVLNSSSLANLSDNLEFVDRVSREDSILAVLVQRAADGLQAKTQQLTDRLTQ